MNKKTRAAVLQYCLYVLLLFLAYILQTTPGFLQFGEYKPMLIMPVMVSIAMQEREFVGGLMGALAGALCDLTSNTYFGFNAAMLLVFGAVTGLLCEYLTQRNLRNCLLLTGLFLVLVSGANYFFQFGIWHYPDAGPRWILEILWTGLPTLVLAVPVFFLFRWLSARFAVMRQL